MKKAISKNAYCVIPLCVYFNNWQKVKVLVAQLFLTLWTPWTVAHQAPQSMGFSRQEYWSGFPCPPPRYLPHPGIKPGSPALQADTLPS